MQVTTVSSRLLDIKRLYRLTGVENKPTVFLFNDTQIVDESFLEDINNVLSSGEVPNLYKPDELSEVRLSPSCPSTVRSIGINKSDSAEGGGKRFSPG